MRVDFEVNEMKWRKNEAIIHHIYESSTHKKPRKNQHPLDLICESMSSKYEIQFKTLIDSNKSDAYVSLVYKEGLNVHLMEQLTKRFKCTTEELLSAKLAKRFSHHSI